MKRLSRDAATSLLEGAGAGCVVAGSGVLFGFGVALMVAGGALLLFGYLASGGRS